METQDVRAPMHLWIVGILSLLWNGFGAFDYFMTRTKGADYIRSMMPTVDADKMMEYVNGFPVWASIGWGLGVWGGLLGSILLLARNRLAAPVFGLSLLGAIFGIGYQLASPAQIQGMDGGANAIIPYFIIAVAAALFVYARRQAAAGVLR